MMHWKFLGLLGLGLSVSGCITTPNPLSVETVASFRLDDVTVSFPPDARLNYTPAEDDFARSKGISPGDLGVVQELVATPEGTAYVRERAAAKMREAFKSEVGHTLNGTLPVRIEVAVTSIDIPGAARSILLSGSATLVARVTLIDVRTGRVINALPSQFEVVGRGSGLIGTSIQAAMESGGATPEPYKLLSDQLAHDYAIWLFVRRTAA